MTLPRYYYLGFMIAHKLSNNAKSLTSFCCRFYRGLSNSRHCLDHLLKLELYGQIQFHHQEHLREISGRCVRLDEPPEALPSWRYSSLPLGMPWFLKYHFDEKYGAGVTKNAASNILWFVLRDILISFGV